MTGSSIDQSQHKSASHARCNTRGRFQSDPDLIRAVKVSAELNRREHRKLLSRNVALKDSLDKSSEKEERSLSRRRETRRLIDELVKKGMAKRERQFAE